MTDVCNEVPQDDHSERWTNIANPGNRRLWTAEDYDAHERRNLEARRLRVIEAASIAVESIPEAYRNPFVRNAAIEAAQIALGVNILSEQGEQ